MNTTNPRAEIERRAFRHEGIDGLTEIALAFIFILLAFTLKNPAFSWMYILPILILGPGLKAIRARHVYPRIGFVEVKGEDPKALFRGMAIYTLLTLIATGSAIYIFRGGLPPDAIRRVSPLMAAVLFGGGLSYAAGKTGLRRYTVLFVICITLATTLVISPIEGRYLNLQIFFVSMGLVSLITGSVLYLHFLRTHPVRDSEGDDDV